MKSVLKMNQKVGDSLKNLSQCFFGLRLSLKQLKFQFMLVQNWMQKWLEIGFRSFVAEASLNKDMSLIYWVSDEVAPLVSWVLEFPSGPEIALPLPSS